MKSIDIKSVLIGILLTLTIIFATGAVHEEASDTEKSVMSSETWNNDQQWEIITFSMFDNEKMKDAIGYEPFATYERRVVLRKRIK